MREVTRQEKAVIWTMGLLDEMRSAGIIEGSGSHKLTDEGRRRLDAIKASGFEPTESEIEWAMNGLTAMQQ